MFVILIGTLHNGFEAVGPFASYDAAASVVERWDDTDWWIFEVKSPEGL